MRTVVVLLLLANLSLSGYHAARQRERRRGRAPQASRCSPSKIKLLTPQQVAALGPAKVAALADVCLEWGPFGEADRARALADLDSLALGKLLTQRRVETTDRVLGLPAAVRRPGPRPTSARRDCGRRDSGTCSSSTAVRSDSRCRSARSGPRTRRTRSSPSSRSRASPAPRSGRASRWSRRPLLVIRDPQRAGDRASCAISRLRIRARKAKIGELRKAGVTRCRAAADAMTAAIRDAATGADIALARALFRRVRAVARTSISASRASTASSRRCPAPTRLRAAACCSRVSPDRHSAASRCARSQVADARIDDCDRRGQATLRAARAPAAAAGAAGSSRR